MARNLDLAVLAAYGVCRGKLGVDECVCLSHDRPPERSAGRLCYRTEISVMEALAAALVIGTVLYILASVAMVVRTARAKAADGAPGVPFWERCAPAF
ncbi:MAG: hypothetical protein V8R55_08075 [Dysosmobacter sp.]